MVQYYLDSNPLTQRGFSLRNGLMFFHVEDENRIMHTSLDAFIIVWKELRGWRYLAKVASLPVLKPLMNRVYKIFARKYWNKLKERLVKEGSQSVTKCHRLTLEAADGKNYLTAVANAETLLRLIQSIPSPKAEPIKLWLAKACKKCPTPLKH